MLCSFLQKTVAEIIGQFEKTVMSVNTLMADPESTEYEVRKKSPPQPDSPHVYIQDDLVVLNVNVDLSKILRY